MPPHPPAGEESSSLIVALCREGVERLNVGGVSVGLVTPAGDRSSLCATDEISAMIEDLQVSLGEGPCVDAWTRGSPVHAPDLVVDAVDRWPVFAPAASSAGAAAIFSVPLLVGTARLGALDVYRTTPGDATPRDLRGQLELGDAVTRLLLDAQSEEAGAGLLAGGFDDADQGIELFQATGMISVQLDVSVGVAIARLRAYAFANDRAVRDVAHDVVTRRLRLENDW